MAKIRLNRRFKATTKVLLPFDEATTKDECGNTWAEVGSPALSSSQVKFGSNSLFVNDENYIQTNDTFTLGGSDFTIDFRTYFSAEKAACTFFSATAFDFFNNREFNFGLDKADSFNSFFFIFGEKYCYPNYYHDFIFDAWNYIAICYNYSKDRINVYVNGKPVSWCRDVGKYAFNVQSR